MYLKLLFAAAAAASLPPSAVAIYDPDNEHSADDGMVSITNFALPAGDGGEEVAITALPQLSSDDVAATHANSNANARPALYNENAFVGRTWNAVKLFNGIELVDVRPAESPLTLKLEGGGRFDGHAGCNTFNGGYTDTDGNTITVAGPLASTMKFCENEEVNQQEIMYLQIFSGDITWTVSADGSELELSDADGNVLAQYVSAPIPELYAGDGDDVAITAVPAGGEQVQLPSDDAAITTTDTDAQPALYTDFDLVGHTWNAVMYFDGEDLVDVLPAESPLTLKFESDGRFDGHAGCNSFNGGYTDPTDSTFTVSGPLASTMMICASEEVNKQEAAYLQIFDGTITWVMSADQSGLELSDADGNVLAQYVAAPVPELYTGDGNDGRAPELVPEALSGASMLDATIVTGLAVAVLVGFV